MASTYRRPGVVAVLAAVTAGGIATVVAWYLIRFVAGVLERDVRLVETLAQRVMDLADGSVRAVTMPVHEAIPPEDQMADAHVPLPTTGSTTTYTGWGMHDFIDPTDAAFPDGPPRDPRERTVIGVPADWPGQ